MITYFDTLLAVKPAFRSGLHIILIQLLRIFVSSNSYRIRYTTSYLTYNKTIRVLF